MSTNRKPLTVVELEQPRCVLSFGEGLCTATGTKCYNTIGTCTDRPNYDGSGSIRWRFMDDRSGSFDFSDFSDPDNIAVGPMPVQMKVSTSESEINAGSQLEGKSPLGITGRVSVSMSDFETVDRDGDKYFADRAGYVVGRAPKAKANFWALWAARNPLFNDMFLRVYDGYEGQSLSEMRQRVHILDNVTGPNGTGGVTLTGLDPLRLASDNRAKFPRASDLDLYGPLTVNSETVRVFGLEGDVSETFGISDKNYLAISSEIIGYSGYVSEGDGVYLLTDVERGALDTDPSEHADQDKVQRVGRYDATSPWLALYDLLSNHTEIPQDFIPLSDWVDECERYIPTAKVERTITSPVDVDKLAGQITQQGLFYVWWDGYAQEVRLLAIRPFSGSPALLTDEADLMRSTTLRRDPRSRLSVVSVLFNVTDPFADGSDENYANKIIMIDGDNIGETRAQTIYAPWVRRRSQAVQIAAKLLIRYKAVPQFLQFSVDAKDREITVGSVIDVETSTIRTIEGAIGRRRWQVVSAKEIRAGHSYMLNCQTFDYLGRFGHFMAVGSPDYDQATDLQKATGSFYAGSDGKISDGTEGYKYQ